MKHVALLLIVCLLIGCSRGEDTAQNSVNEDYIEILERIVVKQRNELFKRGYATDNSVFIYPKSIREQAVKSYYHITGEKK